MARDTTIVLPWCKTKRRGNPPPCWMASPCRSPAQEDGRKCAIEIAEPGRYVLTLFCVPKTENIDGRSQFSLTVPPLLSATIQVRAPERLTGISITNATLLPATNDAPGMLQGELTQADRITVHWPRLEQKNSTSQGLSVAELHWLHVGVDGTELETKYVVEGGGRRPESLTIQYDDRWMPLGRHSHAGNRSPARCDGSLAIASHPATCRGYRSPGSIGSLEIERCAAGRQHPPAAYFARLRPHDATLVRRFDRSSARMHGRR